MSIHPFTTTLRPLALAACAGAITALAPHASRAQEDSSARGGPPRQPYESKSAAAPQQQALKKAHETSIKQAKALQDLTSQEKEELNQADLDRRVQQLGQSVEDARQQLASLEAASPTDQKTRERFDDIREEHDSASERQRALAQQVASPDLNQASAAKISHDAKELGDDMKDAEEEREKLPGAAEAENSSSRQAP